MATTGKRYLQRTKDNRGERIVDDRMRRLLDTIAQERRGKWLEAYLKYFRGRTGSTMG